MERKTKIEIIIAVLIIIALIVALLWMFWPEQQVQIIEEQESEDIVKDQESVIEIIDVSDLPATAETIVRVFVERFGSFSNQSGYENIEAIKEISTSSLKIRLDELAENASKNDAYAYYGISTYVISSTLMSSDDIYQTYEVMTQRQESLGSPANTSVRYQVIEVELVKQGEEWFVNDFEWQE